MINTTTDDLGRIWWASYWVYEAEAISYALTCVREGEIDPIVEEGWYPEEEWEATFQPVKQVVWHEEDLLPGEDRVWYRER